MWRAAVAALCVVEPFAAHAANAHLSPDPEMRARAKTLDPPRMRLRRSARSRPMDAVRSGRRRDGWAGTPMRQENAALRRSQKAEPARVASMAVKRKRTGYWSVRREAPIPTRRGSSSRRSRMIRSISSSCRPTPRMIRRGGHSGRGGTNIETARSAPKSDHADRNLPDIYAAGCWNTGRIEPTWRSVTLTRLITRGRPRRR